MKTAIVTMLRDAGPVLDSFLRYHSSIGFDHFFLFFDAPDDPSIEMARAHPNVTVVVHDEQLRERWRTTRTWRMKFIRENLFREVMARQVLNVDLACRMAAEMGIDWILHIDVDELFYSPTQSVKDHFRSLDERGAGRAMYPNYEVVHESADVGDYFREATCFKRNPEKFPEGMSAEQQEVVKSIPQIAERYFHFYSNGKSAARVVPGLIPDGVHSFALPVEQSWLYKVQRKIFFSAPMRWIRARKPSPGWVRRKLLREGAVRVGMRHDVVILHYPCCGFEPFWKKYVARGKFQDKWFGRWDIASYMGRLHLDGRDVVQRGDREEARRFYEERFVVSPENVERLVACGVAERILAPSRLLGADAGEPEELVEAAQAAE